MAAERGIGPALGRHLGLLAIGSALMLSACGPSGSPSAESSGLGTGAPTGTPASSDTGSPGPGTSAAASGPAPSAPPLALQPNIAVRITVSGLNVRDAPTTGGKKLGSFAKGDVAILLGYGGIKANGYTWYQAGRVKGLHGPLPPLPADPQKGNWSDLFGWIAVAQGSTPWVATLPARCPAGAPDLATLSVMLLGEQLACFSTTPLVIEGTWGCGGCGGTYPGTFTPQWLATPLSGFLSVNWSVRVGPLQLYFPPELTPPAEGSILRVHGHLNEARSSTCAVSVVTAVDSLTATPQPLSPTDSGTYCRQHLVVDSFDILGVDPSFPPLH